MSSREIRRCYSLMMIHTSVGDDDDDDDDDYDA
jgi:hypothetical protein